MRALPDVNVLIALLDPDHTEYDAAHRWLVANLTSGWASSPFTENGCLRIMTNGSYSTPWTPGDAVAALATATSSRYHEFWPDHLSVTDAQVFDWAQVRGHQQVTDVYLLALAVTHGGRLVTFDRKIRRDVVAGCGTEHLVVL